MVLESLFLIVILSVAKDLDSSVATLPQNEKIGYFFRTAKRYVKDTMKTVTVSSKFRVVIPWEMRVAMGIRPGMKLQVLHYDNRLELIPLREPKSLRGFLKGIETDVPREDF